MSGSSEKTNPDLGPLTIGHGRRLFDQSKAISAQLKELTPLLGLLEQATPDADQDPILQIMRFLEALADHTQHQAALLQDIDGKLEYLLANSSINER